MGVGELGNVYFGPLKSGSPFESKIKQIQIAGVCRMSNDNWFMYSRSSLLDRCFMS